MQFLDKATAKIISGHGGNGMVAWRREKYVDKGGPAGGDGGNGGDVYFIADENMSTLMDFKYKSVFKAEDGVNGRSKSQHGKCGKDLYINVPVGTMVKDLKSGKIIGDLTKNSDKILVAKGGRGGRGNARFATAQKRAPQFCEPGEPSIERDLELELKLIADVGLLGMPNAGKSTFISKISSAKPKIADYPFTTLVPHLGVVKKPSGDGFVVADIPGLIEGASEGIGLGHEFLRHVERCRFLVHIIDLTMEKPVENYNKINLELKKHSQKLSELYQIIALNKIDVISIKDRKNFFKKFKEISDDVFLISAVTGENIEELKLFIAQKVDEIEKPAFEVDVEEDLDAYNNDDSLFEVVKVDKNAFAVVGGKIKRLAQVSDARNTEQVLRLQNIMKNMGVMEALKKAGIKDGDTLIIGHLELVYFDDEV
ncbi:MAG TPA: GTPase ObgE [Candidatus Gastranaerophilaceae bacterium]|nr:GTPase ObgE [Candidatus Gastranaerophilaceae bacterium]HPT40922.1 GTPase ObgE [Candidatus Gastranaerophilaceae bacterium]